MTTLGDTQAIARVTDAGHETVGAPAVSLAPARPPLAPVPLLSLPAPVPAAFPAQPAAPMFPVTEQLQVVPRPEASLGELVPADADAPADSAETTADATAADEELSGSAEDDDELPADAELIDAEDGIDDEDDVELSADDEPTGGELTGDEPPVSVDPVADGTADDGVTAEDADATPAADAPPPSHELIYAEAMASIAALAQNWSDAVEGLFDTRAHRAAA